MQCLVSMKKSASWWKVFRRNLSQWRSTCTSDKSIPFTSSMKLIWETVGNNFIHKQQCAHTKKCQIFISLEKLCHSMLIQTFLQLYSMTESWGLLLLKSYVDVPAKPQKFGFLYTNFLLNYPTISIPFSIGKHPILSKLSAFYNNLI